MTADTVADARNSIRPSIKLGLFSGLLLLLTAGAIVRSAVTTRLDGFTIDEGLPYRGWCLLCAPWGFSHQPGATSTCEALGGALHLLDRLSSQRPAPSPRNRQYGGRPAPPHWWPPPPPLCPGCARGSTSTRSSGGQATRNFIS